MERILTPEERYKRAEEIYRRRNGQKVSTGDVHLESKPEIKNNKLKKIINQLMVSVLIYLSIVAIKSADIDLTKDILQKTSYFISYDVDFMQAYNQAVEYINSNYTSKLFKDLSTDNEEQIPTSTEETPIEDTVADENQITQEPQAATSEEDASSITDQGANSEINPEETASEEAVGGVVTTEENNNLDQMQIDAHDIKSKYSFQKPLEGVVSSRFGERNSTNPKVSKYHSGIDIAVGTGTPIKAAISGKVTIVSSQGDFGKHVRITTDDIVVTYAHCSNINVKEGQQISQGDVIALSGNTGNSTGPHLHFQIQKSGRLVNPEYVMQF